MADILCRTAVEIAKRAIFLQLPGPAVERALAGRSFPGRVFAVAAGKAAWPMAQAAVQALGDRLTRGVVVTKYGHVQGPLPRVDCYEGGHPVPDEQGVAGTRAALALTQGLRAEDTVLVLLSGGASALLEQPLIPLAQLRCLTEQLLASGCNIR
ncbi:MAG: DUF4147 domain-containing protein, partial [Firmicutes bacterium]|nr:DUF4147 domain-containing protein [Bacillota bacterium]